METIKEELLGIKKQFKSDRRTKVISSYEKLSLPVEEEKPEKKEGVLCVNAEGRIKLVPTKNYSMASTSATDCTYNEFTPIAFKCTEEDELYVFSNLGNCFRFKLDKIPDKKWREKGAKLGELAKCEKDEEIVSVILVKGGKQPEGELYFYSANGMIKRGNFADYAVGKPSFQAFGLKEGDRLIGVERVLPETTVFFATEKGMCLNCETNDVPVQGRTAGGVKGMNLNDGDKVQSVFQIDGEGEIVVVTESGFAKRVISADFEPSVRYRKGVKLTDVAQCGKVVLYSYVKHPYEIGIIDDKDQVFGVNTEDVEIVDNRTQKGKLLFKQKGIKFVKASVHYGKLSE